MVSEALGAPFEGRPWIAHVSVVDLDQDGRNVIVACDSSPNQIVWLRQSEDGSFVEKVLASDIPGPVHAATADMDADGDLDILVASMGVVFPNNDRIGSVIVLENDGSQNFTRRILLERVARVSDVRAGDFNGDGRLDLAVAQFGYDQGEVRWMENLGDWKFKSHMLLDISGTINVCVADMNGDNALDIVAVVSQQWEEIHLFNNDGSGRFEGRVIFGSTNEDFGSSGITLCDMNRDGRLDVLYSNGDGFDYAQPGPRPWHGVQWLENKGDGFFGYHRIGDLRGAYSPAGVDLDQDGNMDAVAVSGFNDWEDPGAASLVWFRNDGRMNFTAITMATSPTHLMTVTSGNFESSKPALVTGGFHAYPPYERMSRIMIWRPEVKQ
jgi:hypothetical protein